MNKNTKKGYFTLEAAIFLPLFLIGILTIGYFIKVLAIEENVTHAMADEARSLALCAYTRKTAVGFEHRLEQRVTLENASVSQIELTSFKYLFRCEEREGQIFMNLDYRIDVNLPIGFYDGFLRESSLLFRGFIGRQNKGAPMGFQKMEDDQESCLVWVFPRYGEKYHRENCGYIKVEARQKTLNKQIRKKYGACSLCNPESLPNGALVYCFPASGQVYHTGRCKAVDRYVISIEKESAERQGYSSCLKCGG